MLVCITGKSGVGKTTATQYIKELGFNTWIADEYIHEIYQYGNIGYLAIKKVFGDQYVNNKEVDRKKLGFFVFNDVKSLNKLNKIMLPLIRNKLLELKQKNTTIFCELAIYINHENYFKNIFDKVVLISAPKTLEKNNLKNKFGSLRKFPTKRVGSLKNPIKNNKIKYDFYVDNSKNINIFHNNIKKITHKI